jgi:hypothetical protein
MKYDIVAKKEIATQNEIVFISLRLCPQENGKGSGVLLKRNKDSTYIRAV